MSACEEGAHWLLAFALLASMQEVGSVSNRFGVWGWLVEWYVFCMVFFTRLNKGWLLKQILALGCFGCLLVFGFAKRPFPHNFLLFHFSTANPSQLFRVISWFLRGFSWHGSIKKPSHRLFGKLLRLSVAFKKALRLGGSKRENDASNYRTGIDAQLRWEFLNERKKRGVALVWWCVFSDFWSNRKTLVSTFEGIPSVTHESFLTSKLWMFGPFLVFSKFQSSYCKSILQRWAKRLSVDAIQVVDFSLLLIMSSVAMGRNHCVSLNVKIMFEKP